MATRTLHRHRQPVCLRARLLTRCVLEPSSLSRARAGRGTYRGTVVAVTHDRCFLESVAGWILEVDGGRLLPHKGNYTSWLREREGRLREEAQEVRERLVWRGQPLRFSARPCVFFFSARPGHCSRC